MTEGFAAVRNRSTGDRLEFIWTPTENNTLGLWLTRGGWHGHHHFAIEPANASHDTLAMAAEKAGCRRIEAGGSTSWQVRWRISS